MYNKISWKKLSLALILPFVLAFAPPKNSKKKPEGVWVLVPLPSGASVVNDITWSVASPYTNSKCYIATDKGLYSTDLSFSKSGSQWQLVKRENSQYSNKFYDLQFYQGTGGKQLIGWETQTPSAVAKIGVVTDTPNEFDLITPANGRYWRNPENTGVIGRVPGTYDNYFLFSSNGTVQVCSESNGCNVRVTGDKKFYSFGYIKDNKYLCGGDNGKVYLVGGTNFRYASTKNQGISSSAGRIVQISSDRTSNVAYAASAKGYIYKTTDGGQSWKYYSHGIKPYDNPMTLYSMVKFGSYLYISTSTGLYYTKTTGTQADWKNLGGLPGWTGKEIKLMRTPTHLVAFNKTQGGLFKKSYLR